MDNNKLKNTVVSCIKNTLQICMLNLVTNLTIKEDPLPLPAAVTSLQDQIMSKVSIFAELIKNADSDRNDFEKSLSELKYRTVKLAKPIYSLDNYCLLLTNIVSNEHKARSNSSHVAFAPTEETAIDLITDKLSEFEENTAVHNEILKHFMGCIPCNLTKQSFQDYVENAFLMFNIPNIKPSDLECISNELAIKTLPFSNNYMRKLFPQAAEKLDTVLNTKLSTRSETELEDALNSICEISSETFGYIDYISAMFNNINYMLAISLCGYDMDFITDGDIILKDLFFSAVQYQSADWADESVAEIKENIYNKASDKLLKLYDSNSYSQLSKISKKIDPAAENDEELMHLFSVCHFANVLYTQEVENTLPEIDVYKTHDEQATDFVKVGKDFADKFNNAVSDLPPYIKKRLRQNLLSLLPCPYNETDVINYIGSAVKKAENTPAAVSLLGSIADLIKIITDAQHIQNESHHYHNDNCSCGHDHHQHDDCSCGHNHHQHDGCSCGHDHHFHKHL